MSDTRPICLVDVDGVINVFDLLRHYGVTSGDEVDGEVMDFEAEFVANDFNIRVPFGTKDRFVELDQRFDCVWATTWEKLAPKHLSPELGFGADWPVIQFYKGGSGWNTTWKLPTIRDWCRTHAAFKQKVAWIDDDLWEDAEDWAEERGNTLLICTDHREGYTQDQHEQLLEWADE